MLSEWDDDFVFNDDDINNVKDVCPSCATLLSDESEANPACQDPSGCGGFAEDNDDEEETESLEELNFD